ncbi:putative mitochondrial adenine nucleotide transporter BTL3 [Curcuma longa]|uniref:putative mitochondrial adenine nucleotide transporter BTL3 n=1 Tax=Curcuma longa TaxID=136217 RepID=UPI003D9EFA87
MNTTKHLWSGAVTGMVSRTFVAPLERLKLEYILRGEQSHFLVLIHKIATTQGLKGFWKGNLVNILLKLCKASRTSGKASGNRSINIGAVAIYAQSCYFSLQYPLDFKNAKI